MLYLITADGDL